MLKLLIRPILFRLTGLSLAFAVIGAQAADPGKLTGDSVAEEPRGSLFHPDASWRSVLESFAKATGSTLVAPEFPSGRFTRLDRQRYKRSEGVNILNEELAVEGYRLIEQGKFLTLLNLHELRSRYQRPQSPRPKPHKESAYREADFSGFKKPEPTVRTISHRSSTVDNAAASIPGANWIASTFRPVHREPETMLLEAARMFGNRVKVKSQDPLEISWQNEPDNKRSVSEGASIEAAAGRTVFTATVNSIGGLRFQGTPAVVEQASTMFKTLDDSPAIASSTAVRVCAVSDVRRRAEKIESIVRRLALSPLQQPAAQDQSRPAAAPESERRQAQQAPSQRGAAPATQPPPVAELGIGDLEGDVTVEVLEGLGVLVLRGDQDDVETVANLLARLERSARSAPQTFIC